jgi:maleate cis-trans isomerase
MTDALGFRKKFGVIAPSTNTSVQPEFEAMRPRGVTNPQRRRFQSAHGQHPQRDVSGGR